MIGVGGLCSVYDPPVSYWCSEHPSGGGAFAFRTPSGVIYKSPNGPYEHGNLAALMDLYGSIIYFSIYTYVTYVNLGKVELYVLYVYTNM